MGSAVEALLSLPLGAEIPREELRAAQVAAANERLQERRAAIKFLDHRATETGVDEIRDLADIVPLLFAHTTYKSYPETWLTEKRWDRVGKWLGTLSTHPVQAIDLEGITDIDDWIRRLEAAGHFLSCSSGTTGKAAMMNASAADMEWSGKETTAAFAWGSGVAPQRDRRILAVGGSATTARGESVTGALKAAYASPAWEPYRPPVPSITIGAITGMVALRKSIADGTAKPGDIEDYERISAQRQAAMAGATGHTAEALVAARNDKLFIFAKWVPLYDVAKAVRDLGYSAKDFHPENTTYIGGGLKGAKLPDDYREFIFKTFNLSPDRMLQMYSMQELNTSLPKCRAGRYHAPPWLICLPLDQTGEKLEPIGAGEIEARAGFFDLALDGRWGGVISGDKVSIDFGRCKCGAQGPSIADNITRYADLPGGDKITCAGTIDAYVRGLS